MEYISDHCGICAIVASCNRTFTFVLIYFPHIISRMTILVLRVKCYPRVIWVPGIRHCSEYVSVANSFAEHRERSIQVLYHCSPPCLGQWCMLISESRIEINTQLQWIICRWKWCMSLRWMIKWCRFILVCSLPSHIRWYYEPSTLTVMYISRFFGYSVQYHRPTFVSVLRIFYPIYWFS